MGSGSDGSVHKAQGPAGLSSASLGSWAETLSELSWSCLGAAGTTQRAAPAAGQAVAAFMWSVLAHLPLCHRALGRSAEWRSMAPHLQAEGRQGSFELFDSHALLQ